MTQQTQHRPTADEVLMGGGGAPTAKFATPGDTFGGRILAEPRVYQEREYDPRNPGGGDLKFYPKSGDPIMSVSVDVATNHRDPADPEDDGTRRIYIEGKRLKDAVRDAVRATGAPGLQVGGELHVTFTGLGQAESAEMNAPKLYTARYVPAGSDAANAALGTTASVTQAPAPTAAAPAPAPAPAGETPADKARSLIALGLVDDEVARATGLEPAVVAAIRAAA